MKFALLAEPPYRSHFLLHTASQFGTLASVEATLKGPMEQSLTGIGDIVDRFGSTIGWSSEYMTAVQDDYLAFLRSCTDKGQSMCPPSADVDALWHFHMLHPVHYAGFCVESFGSVIDHYVPSETLRPVSQVLVSAMAGTGCNRPAR